MHAASDDKAHYAMQHCTLHTASRLNEGRLETGVLEPGCCGFKSMSLVAALLLPLSICLHGGTDLAATAVAGILLRCAHCAARMILFLCVLASMVGVTAGNSVYDEHDTLCNAISQ
jgi:hypothetical protein